MPVGRARAMEFPVNFRDVPLLLGSFEALMRKRSFQLLNDQSPLAADLLPSGRRTVHFFDGYLHEDLMRHSGRIYPCLPVESIMDQILWEMAAINWRMPPDGTPVVVRFRVYLRFSLRVPERAAFRVAADKKSSSDTDESVKIAANTSSAVHRVRFIRISTGI